MKQTVSGTDDQEYRPISQSSMSSEAKLEVCPITTPRRHIIYTTAQLHEIINKKYFNFNCLAKSGEKREEEVGRELYKILQFLKLSPKAQMSGVTFHCNLLQHIRASVN